MKKEAFTRKELYDLVWPTPVHNLSKKYKISDSGLRKICVKMNLPLPKAGHGQKVKHNKPISILPLPKHYTENKQVELTLRGANEKNKKDSQQSLKSSVKDAVTKKLPTNIPPKPTKPDSLILEPQKSLKSGDIKYSRFNGTVSTQDNELNIRVAPANINRALRFMDALIKLLHFRNHTIEIEYGKTHVVINQHKTEVSLKEKLKIVKTTEHNWTRSDYEPTGILTFRIEDFSKKEWADGKARLEDQLPAILAKLEAMAEKKEAEKIKRET